MNILIPCIGSRGDVQPFIALAQGLERAGHRVTLASHPMMKRLVESHGVKFAPIGPNIDLAKEAARIRQRSRIAMVGLIRGMRFGLDMVERSHGDILALCQAADLMVTSAQSAAGVNEADQLDLPYLSVTLMPWSIPWHDPERPLFKRLAYGAVDGLVSLITTRPLNRMRKRQGLPPVGAEGFTSKYLNLVPVSPLVFAPNPLWEDRHHLVGYWFAEEPVGWEPPQDLLAYLEEGDLPVLVSLGAMSLGDEDALESASLFLEAIQKVGLRAIIQGWESGIRQLSLPPSIHATGSIPHSWLLPFCAGLVHHGGFGTTSAGLRAGKPSLVIPHMIDQFYWGQRLHELGVSPPAIPRPRLTSEGLAAALEQLVNEERLAASASSLSQGIRAEDGIGHAVDLIEATFA